MLKSCGFFLVVIQRKVQTNLIPCIEHHDIVLIQVILGKISYLSHTELARLVRTLKKTGSVHWRRLLKPGLGETGFDKQIILYVCL